MKIQRPIRCPQCAASFNGENVEYTQRTECPCCHRTIIVALKDIQFECDAERESFLQAFDAELSEAVAPLVEQFKKEQNDELTQRSRRLLRAADEIFDTLIPDEIPILMDIVPFLSMSQVRGARDAAFKEMRIPRTKPSIREHPQSTYMECIAESVLATIDDRLRSGLEHLEGLMFFDIPLANVNSITCKVPEVGSFIFTAHGAVTILAAMNQQVLLAAKSHDSRTAEHIQQLLVFVWYLVLGKAHLLDSALKAFEAAADMRNSPEDRSILVTSIVMAEHQLRFIIAHEVGHLLALHFDIPEHRLSKVLAEVRVRTPDGMLHQLIHPAVPSSEIPPEVEEHLRSLDQTAALAHRQTLEIQADRIACGLCLDRTSRVDQRFERYIDRCRHPELARMILFDHILCEGFTTGFANSAQLLMTYFVLRDLARDLQLEARVKKHPGSTVPDTIQTHPWPELRLNCLQDSFRQQHFKTGLSESVISLTDRGTFWGLNQALVEQLWEYM